MTYILALFFKLLLIAASHQAAVTPHVTPATTTPVHVVAARVIPAAPVPAPAPVETPCAAALAYLHAHGNPALAMYCTPGALGNGVLDTTTLRPNGGGWVTIGDPSCWIGVENEASNSWIDVHTLTGGSMNDHARHDASGRIVDPYGECG